jgi:hypothetical protein
MVAAGCRAGAPLTICVVRAIPRAIVSHCYAYCLNGVASMNQRHTPQLSAGAIFLRWSHIMQVLVAAHMPMSGLCSCRAPSKKRSMRRWYDGRMVLGWRAYACITTARLAENNATSPFFSCRASTPWLP